MVPWRPVIQVIALRVLRRRSKGGRGAQCQEWSGWHRRGAGGVVGVVEMLRGASEHLWVWGARGEAADAGKVNPGNLFCDLRGASSHLPLTFRLGEVFIPSLKRLRAPGMVRGNWNLPTRAPDVAT